ncbi:MAG: FAD-dependent oxidoreductase, partial [Pseudomonadota bacterium]
MTSVAIVGAGIVGTATAFELARSGCDVTVFDPHPAGEGGASFGNASHIGLADIHPLSTPGIHITAARMLMNRDGPLKIPLTDVPRYAGWFWKFWRTSQGTRFQNATAALTELGRTCRQDTTAMFKAAQIGHKLKFDGAAYVYDNHQSFS